MASDPSAAGSSHRQVILASATDLDGFRAACRELWAAQVPPELVSWHTAADPLADLFADTAATPAPAGAPAVGAPASFLTLCQTVALHHDPDRFGLLYRWLWRLQREPSLRHDVLDADWVRAQQMAQAVRRDIHKMKAFVRFRILPSTGMPSSTSDGAAIAHGPLHVAWFEPEHHIVEAAAPFFARRFTHMRWAILTPERCVRWNGVALEFEAGADRSQAPPADAGESLWLTYYQHIFNPARLKVAMMQKEMPRRYWHNLPEAQLISPLVAQAHERSRQMIDEPPSEPKRRIRPGFQASTLDAGTDARPVFSAGRSATPHDEAPTSLAQLRALTECCRACPIGEHATQAVSGEGPAHARLMFVGEQPGDQEDLAGRPFVGPAGQLFNRALGDLGVARDAVFVTNAVRHFKFELRGKRRIHKTPAQQEAAACLHWLESEIALVRPEALVALGATAARQLMGSAVAVTRLRGQWLTRSDGLRVLITLHPSALLRMDPADKAAAYAAWLADLRHAASFLVLPDANR